MSGNVRLSKTVLLVDDLDILRKMIRDFLKSLGIEVLEVSNATEAIHTARSDTGTIDLLLTDVEMSGMSGWDLAPEIAGRKPGIRILYMSAAVSLQERDNYKQKPFRLEELKALLMAIFSQ